MANEAFVSSCPLGIFAYDAKGSLLAKQPFTGDAKERFEQLQACQKPDLSAAEKELLKNLKGFESIIFEVKKYGHKHDFPNIAGKVLRASMPKLAQQLGMKTNNEFLATMHSICLEMTKEKMSSLDVNDKLLIQAISTIDDLDKITNTMAMRLREWYGMYFPEIEAKITDNFQFAKYVAEETYRKEAKDIDIEETIGAEVSTEDLEQIKNYAQSILQVYNHRSQLEAYVETKAKQLAPNMYAIISGQLTAKMISRAGGLDKLSSFPSSTLQVLGAEKALFRFLKGQGTSPKYGLIFQSTYVQKAQKDDRGKVARILASKLSLAAKLDFYKGTFMGDSLKTDVENALKSSAKRSELNPKDRNRDFERKPKKNFNNHKGRRF